MAAAPRPTARRIVRNDVCGLEQDPPRHLLEQPLDAALASGDLAGFVNSPFWTVDYVGAGPYRLTQWEPGAFLEAAAFDGHALGKPKIDGRRSGRTPQLPFNSMTLT